ncbi:hypothetical protein [Streptomyces sp. CA-106110]|uniref:hypothetical protein n=1 Tax=Streptomyces sp. CA-106110 TaxID=3240044 RepID=UPI003D93E5E6
MSGVPGPFPHQRAELFGAIRLEVMHGCLENCPRCGRGRVAHRADAGQLQCPGVGGHGAGDRVSGAGDRGGPESGRPLPALTFTGFAEVTYPPGPIFPPIPIVPPNPVRPVSTVLRDVVGTGGGVSCDARGAETFQLNRATDTLTFTGSYTLHPGAPIQPQNALCAGHQIGVQYVAHLDSAGQVIGVPAATFVCVELNCNNESDNP